MPRAIRLTKRALDAGDCPALTCLGWAMVAGSSLAQSAASIFLASSFFCSQAASTPAPAPLPFSFGDVRQGASRTQTVKQIGRISYFLKEYGRLIA